VSEAEIARHFRLDENCVPVAEAPRARVYFAQLRRALGALQHEVEQETPITNAERSAVAGFVARLRRTLEALALRHFFPRPGAELRIDTTDSGFFHWSLLLELGADVEGRAAALAKLPDKQELKRRMLEQIVRYSLHPAELQAELMRRIYLESLDEGDVFRPFLPGPLAKVGGADDAASWLWSFASYDRALNRPFLYLVYFEWAGKPLEEGSDAFAELCAAAERAALGRSSLLVVSRSLDEALPSLRPRIVKRIVLGPFWSHAFTGSEGPLGPLFATLGDRWPFALRCEAELLISERETRVGAGWLSKGRLRQVFWLSEDTDLAARGVSQLERRLILPHWLAQRVKSDGLLPDHRLVPLEEAPADGVA
jgi:hypothetical protein